MMTPILLTALLLLPLAVGGIHAGLFGKPRPSVAASAAAGLALVFAFTGGGHFVKTAGMVDMLPAWIPWRERVVLASGLFEWMLAGALLIPKSRRIAAWASFVFLITLLPINIWAALNSTGLGGHQWGPVYLWIRVPLQGLFLVFAVVASSWRSRS